MSSSNLPEIDQTRVIDKLALRLAEAQKQLFTMETLAETLRDERDKLREQLNELQAQVQPVVDTTNTKAVPGPVA